MEIIIMRYNNQPLSWEHKNPVDTFVEDFCSWYQIVGKGSRFFLVFLCPINIINNLEYKKWHERYWNIFSRLLNESLIIHTFKISCASLSDFPLLINIQRQVLYWFSLWPRKKKIQDRFFFFLNHTRKIFGAVFTNNDNM